MCLVIVMTHLSFVLCKTQVMVGRMRSRFVLVQAQAGALLRV